MRGIHDLAVVVGYGDLVSDGFAEWQAGDHDDEDARVLRDETQANTDALLAGPEDWVAWWHRHGEREPRCILMTAWDPIGPDLPWDEYDSYLPAVALARRDHADEDEAEAAIRQYLDHVVVDSMGVEYDADRICRTARVSTGLVAWYEWSYRHGGRKANRMGLLVRTVRHARPASSLRWRATGRHAVQHWPQPVTAT